MYINEIAASLYPWDLADEGVDQCIENLIEHADVNSVYLIGIMHKEKRPVRGLYYPHNPRRKYYLPEDSRVYYRMDEKNFKNTPLKPIYSSVDWLKDVDWLELLIKGARKKQMKVGVEISHTVFDSGIALRDFPHMLQRNIKGDLVGGIGLKGQILCPNNEDVREYIKNLFYDTCKNHEIDFIQSCLVLFSDGTDIPCHDISFERELSVLLSTVKGGCFCESCKSNAIELGYDWEKIIHDISKLYDVVTGYEMEDSMEKELLDQSNLLATGLLLEYPSLFEWHEFRQISITSLFKSIYEAIQSANPNVEFRYNTYLKYPELAGLNFSAIKDYIDSIRESDYSEMQGDVERLKAKREKVLKIRRGIGYEKDIIAAIDVRPNRFGGSNEEVVKQSTRLTADLGIDGLSLGHYDEATFARLNAFKEGMKEGGITVKKREDFKREL